jgi:hypothetical protein
MDGLSDPPIWAPNSQHQINIWIRDPKAKVNQYTDLEVEPSQANQDAEIFSQSHP